MLRDAIFPFSSGEFAMLATKEIRRVSKPPTRGKKLVVVEGGKKKTGRGPKRGKGGGGVRICESGEGGL